MCTKSTDGFPASLIGAPVRGLVLGVRNGQIVIPPTEDFVRKLKILYKVEYLPYCCEELKIKAVVSWPVWNNHSFFVTPADRCCIIKIGK